MAAIGVSRIKIDSSTDPHFETYIISAEKIPPYYGNIDNFMRSLPMEISMNMKKDYENPISALYKNVSYSTLIDQAETGDNRTVTGNIIMKRRSQSFAALVKQISIPVAFQLKSEEQRTSNFVSQLTLELYVRGITITDYRLSTVNLIYRGDM